MHRLCVMVIARSWVCISNAFAQPPTPGIVSSPCPPPDPAAEARLKPIDDLFMTPSASPEAFWAEFAKLQATALAGDAERNRAQQAADWPNLCRYKAANAALARGPQPRAVFMGDSITDNWVRGDPALFANGIVGRGIGGQTSPQMLARFRQDVVALRPRVVHIMAGTNDVAGNTGPTTLEDYQHNMLAMIDLARANDISLVIAAIPPSRRLFWRGDLDPRPQIREMNEWLRGLAFSRGLTFVDYGMVLADPDGGMRADLGNDGVHPNRLGYARMRPLAERAVAEAVERADPPAGLASLWRAAKRSSDRWPHRYLRRGRGLPVPLSSRRRRHRSPVRAHGTRRSGSRSGRRRHQTVRSCPQRCPLTGRLRSWPTSRPPSCGSSPRSSPMARQCSSSRAAAINSCRWKTRAPICRSRELARLHGVRAGVSVTG